MNIHNAIISGRTTKDIELAQTPNGKSVAKFTLAVDDSYGENKSTYFFNIVAWGTLAETVSKHLRKGGRAVVVGKIVTRSWEDKDTGGKRYATEIVAETVEIIDWDKTVQNEKADPKFEDIQSGDDLPF